MSAIEAPTQGHAREHGAAEGDELLLHHFDDMRQQNDSSTLGMWAFLATEVMFFGGLFAAYTIFRILYPEAFIAGSRKLNIPLGALNTVVLLTSSLTMALAVRESQLRRTTWTVRYLLATMALGTIFLGVKFFEWYEDYEQHLAPGLNWAWNGPDPGHAQLFFVMYFCMTGLHALHMIIGFGLLGTIAWLVHRRWLSAGGSLHVEIAGLYWHFVDIVWVFLYPLLYLIDAHK